MFFGFFSLFKGPGEDGLVIELFKNGTDEILECLGGLFNRIMDDGEFPTDCLQVLVMSGFIV